MRGVLRRPNEDGLRKVEFGGNGLHLQAERHDGKRVAGEPVRGKNIDGWNCRRS